MSKQFAIVLGVTIAGALAAQVPALERDFLVPATVNSPHLVFLAEGIAGVLLVWFAGRGNKQTAENNKPQTNKPGVALCAALLLLLAPLAGCAHSLLLVKAVQVSQSENHFTKCIVESSERVSPELKQKAAELCAEVQKEFPPNLPGIVPPTPQK